MSIEDDLIGRIDAACGDVAALQEIREEIMAAFQRDIGGDGVFDYLFPSLKPGPVVAWLSAKKERQQHELDVARANGGLVNVSSNSTSSASVDQSFWQQFERVGECDGLSDGQRDEVKALLVEAKGKVGKDPSGFGETAMKAIAAVGSCAEAIPVVVQALGAIAAMIR